MAHMVLTDCFISIDGTEFSGQGTNVAIAYSAEALDITPFGDDTRIHSGGVKEWSMEFELIQDEEATGQLLFDMVGQTVPIEVRPSSAEVGPGNPAYVGSGTVTEYTPLGGAHGELSKATLSVVSASTLTREIVPQGGA